MDVTERTDERRARLIGGCIIIHSVTCETAKPSLEDALTEDVKTISGHVLSCIGSCENQQKWSTSYWNNVLKKNGPTKCPRVQ